MDVVSLESHVIPKLPDQTVRRVPGTWAIELTRVLRNEMMQHHFCWMIAAKLLSTDVPQKGPVPSEILHVPASQWCHVQNPSLHHMPAKAQKLVESFFICQDRDVEIQGFNQECGLYAAHLRSKVLVWVQHWRQPEEGIPNILVQHLASCCGLSPVAALQNGFELAPCSMNQLDGLMLQSVRTQVVAEGFAKVVRVFHPRKLVQDAELVMWRGRISQALTHNQTAFGGIDVQSKFGEALHEGWQKPKGLCPAAEAQENVVHKEKQPEWREQRCMALIFPLL